MPMIFDAISLSSPFTAGTRPLVLTARRDNRWWQAQLLYPQNLP
jgi:hypothetical protein